MSDTLSWVYLRICDLKLAWRSNTRLVIGLKRKATTNPWILVKGAILVGGSLFRTAVCSKEVYSSGFQVFGIPNTGFRPRKRVQQ